MQDLPPPATENTGEDPRGDGPAGESAPFASGLEFAMIKLASCSAGAAVSIELGTWTFVNTDERGNWLALAFCIAGCLLILGMSNSVMAIFKMFTDLQSQARVAPASANETVEGETAGSAGLSDPAVTTYSDAAVAELQSLGLMMVEYKDESGYVVYPSQFQRNKP